MSIKPTLLSIKPFDATRGASIYFSYFGSTQSYENELVITDLSTNKVVYSYLLNTIEKVHHIPPNQLINGKSYKAKLRVKLTNGSYTEYSNEVQFKAISTPILDIVSIDGQGYVYNSDVTFVAEYSQKEDERVKSYRFKLYDEDDELLTEYPRRMYKSGSLSETVRNLEKGKGYFIECNIETVNGVVYNHKERFIPLYVVPNIRGRISTTNDKEEGFIRVSANLKQITGTQVTGSSINDINSDSSSFEQVLEPYKYINNDWVVVPKGNALFYNGLGMNRASDFVMKLWCKDIDDGRFLELSPISNQGIAIQLWKKGNKIVAVKENGSVRSIHASNTLSMGKGVEFMVYLKAIEHRLEIQLKLV